MHRSSSAWAALSAPARAVALEVLYRGPLSRAELARRLGLSAGSLTRLSSPLLDAGLLTEIGVRPESRIGRPAVLLDIDPGSRHFIGIKLTGDEAHAVLTTLRAEVVASARAPLARHRPDDVVGVMGELVATLSDNADDVAGVGVGIGGVTADHATVTSAPFLEWGEVPLAAMITERTGLPCVVENDVVAVTEAAHRFGAGRDSERFAVITIGVGIGYGLVVHDRLVTGPDVGVGLAGHLPLDPAGPLCKAGHRGCAMAMLSTPAICAALSVGLGREVGYDEFLALAAAGDPLARRVADDAGRALGRFVALVANLTMARKIIITGDGIGLADVARAAMDARIAEDRDPRVQPVDVDVQAFDFFEWARGGAVIAIQTYVRGNMPAA